MTMEIAVIGFSCIALFALITSIVSNKQELKKKITK